MVNVFGNIKSYFGAVKFFDGSGKEEGDGTMDPYATQYAGVIDDVQNNYGLHNIPTAASCLRLISSTISQMRLNFVYYDNGVEKKASEIEGLARFAVIGSNPSNRSVPCNFWNSMVRDMLEEGIAYCALSFQRSGETSIPRLTYFPAKSVEEKYLKNGNYEFIVEGKDNTKSKFTNRQMLRFPYQTQDGYKIKTQNKRILQGIYLRYRYTDTFLESASSIMSLLQYNGEVTDATAKNQRKMVNDAIRKNRSHIFFANGKTDVVSTIQRDPLKEVLTPETQEERVKICGMFGVPPLLAGYMEGASNFGSGISSLYQGYMVNCIEPILCTIEQELQRKIIAPRYSGNEFPQFRFNRDYAIPIPPKDQAEIDAKSLGQGVGWRTPNELRRAKNLPLFDGEGGDLLATPPDNAIVMNNG